ncbi:uncharacterized protein LOC115764403 isoform X1 [Drosophila novamexicana]|uniref:uncharacterized protein LOC115764403 isoform X1 n=1 Tax=Drosophila novamexicana TaxID=47314 RepID=UPI0011E5B53B|nr:uncharacterized protein LOC115764403 isoform X1 [Drosophila novamexicana]
MAYFGVYIPPSKAGFEGTLAQCAGSIAADNIKISPEYPASAAEEASKYEDPEYPPDSPLWLIFKEKAKALDVLRHYKEARLREFPNREQAESYVQFGFESIQSLKRYGKAKPASKPVQLPTTPSGGFRATSGTTDSLFSSSPTNNVSGSPCSTLTVSMSNMLLTMPSSNSNSNSNNNCSSSISVVTVGSMSASCSSGSSGSTNSLNAERPPFRAPTKQELVEFRKQIEAGNYERVKRVVWDNPRFLISSGDTPTSLKEGYRYNAMHICAQVNQARVAELILKIISDREFTQLYAGKKSSGEMCAALNVNLLDYYLNMPDKGRGETPLHFAAKNGHVAVVEVLISYPQCKSLKNTEGMYPKDIICQRAPNASPELFKKLELLLSEPHYVPVLRAVGNELPPQIGQPFTPNDPPILQHKTDESDRLNVDLKISALAGPMPREQALSFFRRWKTPPRVGSNVMSPLASSPYISPMKTHNKSVFNKSTGHVSSGRRTLFSPRAATPNKSLSELNGNHKSQQEVVLHNSELDNIEHNNNFPSCLPKRMLDMPTTPMRQMKPDLFLKYRSNSSSPLLDETSFDLSSEFSINMSVSTLNDSFRERHIKNSDIEKGLEVVGRQLARQEQLEWREYWDFLDAFVDMASISGLTRLESYLSAKFEKAQASMLAEKSDQAWNFSQMNQYIDLVADRGKSNSLSASGGGITQVMTPYTCVEKSLQVFAKRITKTLMNNIGNMVSINDTLLSELKRLKSLIVSFKDDARFISVDFSRVHSRIAHLVASYIAHSQEVSAVLRNQLMQMMRKMLQLNGERREHLYCVCASMLHMLEQAPTVSLPDALKTEELCSAAWELEQCCNCLWDGNLSRKTSRRKRTESMRAQAQDLANAAATLRSSGASNVAVVTPILKANAWRSNENQSDDDDEDSDDESFFFDCGGGSDSSEDEEIFMTPPESRSPRLSCDLDPRYELFIFGKEPTKRDLDVLNAIFHVDTEKESLPFVHAWRTAMENFSTAEMDLFPSPKNVQKTHKPAYFVGSTPKTPSSASGAGQNKSSSSILADSVPLVHPKRLFATPKLNAAALRRHSGTPTTPPKSTRVQRVAGQNGVVQDNPWPLTTSSPKQTASPLPSFTSLAVATVHQKLTVAAVSQSFQTPLNKMRGLFSKYRETRQEASPMPVSPDFISSRLSRSLSVDESD